MPLDSSKTGFSASSVRRQGQPRQSRHDRQSIVDAVAASGQIIHPHCSPHFLFTVALENFHVKVRGPAQHLARDGTPGRSTSRKSSARGSPRSKRRLTSTTPVKGQASGFQKTNGGPGCVLRSTMPGDRTKAVADDGLARVARPSRSASCSRGAPRPRCTRRYRRAGGF